jgi:hypothetical protein
MSGEGTGGGGALALVLALWIGAVGILIGGDPLQEASTRPGPIGEPGGTVVEGAAPSVPECDEDCEQPITRAELATAFADAFQLPMTTNDFFTDDADSPHEPNINRLAASEITRGCGGERFCPDEEVTRGEMATLLSRAIGLPETDADHFGDDDGTTHEASINRLAEAGITRGCGDGVFCPDEPVTRSQLVTFMTRALSLDDSVA